MNPFLATLPLLAFAQPFFHSSPIWAPGNTSAKFVYFRSAPFALTAPAPTARVLITSFPSPNVAGKSNYSHLLGSFTLFVNGVPAATGPGRATLWWLQLAVTSLDVAHLLRPAPEPNVLAVACFLSNAFGGEKDASAVPRLQVELACGGGGCAVASGSSWLSLDASAYHNVEGDSTHHSPWYHQQNEDLLAPLRPLGWLEPAFLPPPTWVPAVVQPAFPAPLYVEALPSPDMLWRRACSVMPLGGTRQVVDFGQQLNGGVNLSFVGAPGAWPAGARVTVMLGEELFPNNGSVVVPARSSVNYSAVWTLDAAGSPNNAFLVAHEFVQFRYAEIVGSPVALTPDTAQAWVVQHFGGNPFAAPECAVNLPYVGAPPPPPVPPLTGRFSAFSSASAPLDEVFRFTAFTAIAGGGLDVNVDSQTRQRDMCNVDAAITAAEQYAVFPAGDYALQRRTARLAATNESGIWETNWEFRASTALMVSLDVMESGDLALANATWSADDASARADSGDFASVQFMAGLRFFNRSGNGLFHIPPQTSKPATSCGGLAGGCDPLIDWPVQTRGGYVVSAEDAIRNGISAAAVAGLAQIAAARGDAAAAARYKAVGGAIRAAMLREMLRVNGSEAFFVDGSSHNATAHEHASIHSTLYAVAGAGVADVALNEGSDPALACGLAAYLARLDTGGASCMTARWHVEALFRLGVQCGAAADAGVDLLSRDTYPGWVYMMSAAGGSATMTLEAWSPPDKWNTDFSHRD
jgi:alpha-L-rhamnosidase